MRVLQLISSGGVYGTEKMLISLVKSLGKHGCECVVGVFDNLHIGSSGVVEESRAQGLAAESIPCNGRIDFKAVRWITDCIEKHGIDLVHTHGYKADIYGYAAARRLRRPIVATAHYWTRRTLSLRFYKHCDQLVLRRFHSVAAVSDEIAGSILHSGTPADRVLTIDNGIDLAPFRSVKPSLAHFRKGTGAIVGAVGRLTAQKGFDYLLRAVPGILKQHPDTMFLIVGAGGERQSLEALVRELQVGQNVVFVGQRSDMPNVYASFDVFAMPSIDEGMPIAVLEALASGCATIATRVAAVPKLIINNKTGFLVEPKNPKVVENGIRTLLEDSKLRKTLAANGRAWVERNYSADIMAERYQDLYQAAQACFDLTRLPRRKDDLKQPQVARNFGPSNRNKLISTADE